MEHIDNDTRGWIMTGVSGIACIIGASIICVDLIVQRFPRTSHWRIQDSDVFLSSSLALSFGVMIFSALNSMLPSAKASLIKGGLSTPLASWVLVSCFLGGLVAIGILSKIMHHFIPSHIVDCEHSHSPELEAKQHTSSTSPTTETRASALQGSTPGETEETPLLGTNFSHHTKPKSTIPRIASETQASTSSKRPLLSQNLRSSLRSFVSRSSLQACGEQGACHGFDELCDSLHCKYPALNGSWSRPGRSYTFVSTPNGRARRPPISQFFARSRADADEEAILGLHGSGDAYTERSKGFGGHVGAEARSFGQIHETQDQQTVNAGDLVESDTDSESHAHIPNSKHHHHVHTNVFLSIGLQTSIAIALHKLPEGFITYATNHANPKLGFAVFIALFIHNITEGFALALPLYLALGSRAKAMLVASVLGGASQPLGAGIAALWLSTAARHEVAPSEVINGIMFAGTAGILTLVALQLFGESLSIGHSRTTCTIFGVLGMGILGVSNALTSA